MLDKIKKLYQEAGELHKRAMETLDADYGEEGMPQEKANEVDALLDRVEKLTGEAKRLERAHESQRTLVELANDLPAPVAPDAKAAQQELEFKRDVFRKFVAVGHKALTDAELKALAADEDVAGGYLVPDEFRRELIQKQRQVSAMRRIARVLPPVPSGSVITPAEESFLSDAEWTIEIGTGSEDSVKPFGERVLTPHPLAKRIKVSNTLLRGSMIDAEAWVREQLAYKLGTVDENAFINGTGARQPLGLLNTTSLPTYTTANSQAVDGDDIITWIYSLPTGYAANARIMCHRFFVREVRKLKDGSGAYLWAPGLQVGVPNTILEVPYEFSDLFDDALTGTTWDANGYPAVIGDFRYYWIVDSLTMTIQRLVELYAETNQTGFIARKETDGMALLAEACYALTGRA